MIELIIFDEKYIKEKYTERTILHIKTINKKFYLPYKNYCDFVYDFIKGYKFLCDLLNGKIA